MFTKDMWLRVVWLQKKLEARYPDDLRLNHLISCVQINKEVAEVLDCVPWKFERGMESVSREALLEELVDVFRFYCRLLFIHNIRPEEFQEAFDKKSNIVERRLLDEIQHSPSLEKSIRNKIQ